MTTFRSFSDLVRSSFIFSAFCELRLLIGTRSTVTELILANSGETGDRGEGAGRDNADVVLVRVLSSRQVGLSQCLSVLFRFDFGASLCGVLASSSFCGVLASWKACHWSVLRAPLFWRAGGAIDPLCDEGRLRVSPSSKQETDETVLEGGNTPVDRFRADAFSRLFDFLTRLTTILVTCVPLEPAEP